MGRELRPGPLGHEMSPPPLPDTPPISRFPGNPPLWRRSCRQEVSPAQLQLPPTLMGELISCPPWFIRLLKGLLLGPG